MTSRDYSEDEMETIRKILNLGEKSAAVVQKLFDLCHGMAFFSTFIDKLLPGPLKESAISLFECATYEKIKKEKEVFMEGDSPNDKCYVILSGRVGVYRGKVHCDIKIGNLGTSSEADEGKYPSFKDAVYQGENLRMLRKLSFYGDLLAKITFGRLFGDTGLLNDDPRNASIVTLEDTEFMVFHKHSLESIKNYYSKDFNKKKTYLMKMIPELGMIKNQLRITQLLEFFKPISYQHGAWIMNEGTFNNKIYFLEEGEITLFKGVPLPEVENNRKIKYQTHQLPIMNVQGNAIVGEEVLENGNNSYRYTIQVKSAEAKLYVFEKSSNFSDFQSFPLFAILLKAFKLKEKTRQKLVGNIQIQKYEDLLSKRTSTPQKFQKSLRPTLTTPKLSFNSIKMPPLNTSQPRRQLTDSSKGPSNPLNSATLLSQISPPNGFKTAPKTTDLSNHILSALKSTNSNTKSIMTSNIHNLSASVIQPNTFGTTDCLQARETSTDRKPKRNNKIDIKGKKISIDCNRYNEGFSERNPIFATSIKGERSGEGTERTRRDRCKSYSDHDTFNLIRYSNLKIFNSQKK